MKSKGPHGRTDADLEGMEAKEGAMTQAEQVSAELDDDGQVWSTAEDVSLPELCDALGARRETMPHTTDSHRYAFPDGSVIVSHGDAWDYGYPDCWCWAGNEHGCCQPVMRSETGCYERNGDVEDWESVCDHADSVTRDDGPELQGWEPYRHVYRVEVYEHVTLYMVP